MIDKYFETNNPVATVLHVDLGTYQSTMNTLRGQKSASYHFYIRKNGKVKQLVPIDKGAWHAGNVHRPTEEARKLFGKKNPNKQSIGICYEGKPLDKNGNVTWNWENVVDGEKANQKQVQKCAELTMSRDLPKTLLAHKEITSYKPACVMDFKERVDSKIYREELSRLQRMINRLWTLWRKIRK